LVPKLLKFLNRPLLRNTDASLHRPGAPILTYLKN